jgi:hypothetical protein
MKQTSPCKKITLSPKVLWAQFLAFSGFSSHKIFLGNSYKCYVWRFNKNYSLLKRCTETGHLDLATISTNYRPLESGTLSLKNGELKRSQ